MATKYGKTWWGKRWLDALQGIDYSNRLPRGRTYANTKRVPSIELKDDRIYAKVQGRLKSPYRVELGMPRFSDEERNAILDAVQSNPFVLGELSNRRLPNDVLTLTEELHIELLPTSWDSLDGHCSCPDWAVPCKHIAAVVYLLANEIDVNPFLVFELHGLNLPEEIKERTSIDVQEIANIPRLPVETSREPIGEPPAHDALIGLLDMDLSAVPWLGAQIRDLLPRQPLFHPNKDFHKIQQEHYRRTATFAYRFDDLRSLPSSQTQTHAHAMASLVVDKNLELLGSRQGNRAVDQCTVAEVVNQLSTLQLGDPKHLGNRDHLDVFWSVLYRFALKLIEQHAYIPAVVTNNADEDILIWQPASLASELSDMLDTLYRHCPVELVVIQKAMGTRAQKTYLDKKSQVDIALDLVLNHFVSTAFREKAPQTVLDDPVCQWFYTGEREYEEGFLSHETLRIVHQWLSCLTLRSRDYQIQLVVEDQVAEHDEETDFLQAIYQTTIAVSLRIETDGRSKTVAEILNDENQAANASLVFSDLSFLSHYFEGLETLLGDATIDDKNELQYSLEEFTPILTKALPTLRLLGVQLVMPKNLEQFIRPQVGLRISTSSPANISFLSLNDIVQFNWEVAIGDTHISSNDFLTLVDHASGLVRIRDKYLLLEAADIRSLVKHLENLPDKLTSRELLHATLTGELENASVDLDGAMQALRDRMLDVKTVQVPHDLCGELREYQKRGFEWLVQNSQFGFGSLLADDMGLGKTIQVIALLLHQKAENLLTEHPALIVAPTSLLTNWQKELARFAPSLSVDIYHGVERSIENVGADVILSSYGTMRNDIDILSKKRFLTLVIDEAQNIKNPKTAQTRAIKQIKAKNRIALSGTPVENRLLDYWSIFDFAMRGYLGTQEIFQKAIARPIELERNQTKLEHFRKLTRPFILRRLKSDKSIIRDLPDKLEAEAYCTLSPQQASLYQSVVERTLKQIAEETDPMRKRGLTLKLINSLKQICNAPSHYLKRSYVSSEESGKLAMFIEVLREVFEAGEKALIFTQFTEMGKLLIDCAKSEFDLDIPMYHGSLGRKKREEIVEAFQEDRHEKAMILSLKAGGTGLNLTAASHVLHYDLWWNPAVENQATDRAYRIGQSKNVMVHRFVTVNTFEEKINDLLATKRELAELTETDGEFRVTEMSQDELRELVSLEASN